MKCEKRETGCLMEKNVSMDVNKSRNQSKKQVKYLFL